MRFSPKYDSFPPKRGSYPQPWSFSLLNPGYDCVKDLLYLGSIRRKNPFVFSLSGVNCCSKVGVCYNVEGYSHVILC